MTKFKEAIAALERIAATRSRNDKEKNLLEAKGNKILLKIIKLTFGGHTFGIHAPKKKLVSQTSNKNTKEKWRKFTLLCKKLIKRRLTGNKALDATNSFLDMCSDLEYKWYSRILNRDLKIGISHKTIKKVFPELLKSINGYNDCMLADTWNEKYLSIWDKNSTQVEPKLDGIRVTTIIGKNGSISLFTRRGKQIEHLSHITEEVKNLGASNIVLDGEIVVYADKKHIKTNWRKTLSIVKPRKHISEKMCGEIKSSVFYVLFDLIPLEDYKNGICNLPLRIRRKRLKELITNSVYLEVINAKIAKTADNLKIFYKKCIDAGYEGIIIKNRESPYENKRKNSWMKLKPVKDQTGKIIAVQKGNDRHAKVTKKLVALIEEHLRQFGSLKKDKTGYSIKTSKEDADLIKGELLRKAASEDPWLFQRVTFKKGNLHVRTAPRLGSLIVHNISTDDKVRVSGMSDALREKIWDSKKSFIGKRIDYKEQDDRGDVGVSRFPVFIRFRED